MFDYKFCLVVGTFFQEKINLNRPTIFNTMFLGAIDFKEKVGGFQDRYGDSDVEIISVTKKEDVVKLVFVKTYEKIPFNSIHYELFSKSSREDKLIEWVGTWRILENIQDYGSVRMQTIFTERDVSDYKITNKLLQQFISEKNLPF